MLNNIYTLWDFLGFCKSGHSVLMQVCVCVCVCVCARVCVCLRAT